MDADLYMEVRKQLKRGATLQQVREDLLEEGHSKADIQLAIQEFFKDEATDYDDKLIEEIEDRFDRGELMQNIIDDLVKKGNKPFEVEKALLRASTSPGNVFEIFRGWKWYTYIQAGIFLMTFLLGIFYTPLFFITTFFMAAEMLISFAGIPAQNKSWVAEVNILPFGGLWITQGVFGYNKAVGNYFRWWILEPSTVLAGFFILFGAFFGMKLGLTFFSVCVFLAFLSFIAFSESPD